MSAKEIRDLFSIRNTDNEIINQIFCDLNN